MTEIRLGLPRRSSARGFLPCLGRWHPSVGRRHVRCHPNFFGYHRTLERRQTQSRNAPARFLEPVPLLKGEVGP
jgi:hypothetical protein